MWLWGRWGCGKKLRPFPEPPTDTLGFSGRVALPTSEQAVRRLPVGCVASTGHTSTLISRSPSKYLTGDEIQVPWDSWARAALSPCSGPALCLCSASHVASSPGLSPSPWLPGCRSVAYPRCPQSHDCGGPGWSVSLVLRSLQGVRLESASSPALLALGGEGLRGAQLRHAAPCVSILTQNAHCWPCEISQL